MSVTVIAEWDQQWFESERTERRLWSQTLGGFNVDNWIMTPKKDVEFTWPLQYDTIEEAMETVTGKRTFLVPPTTYEGQDLCTYQHPEDAIYVFGTTADSLMRFHRETDDAVSIYAGEMFGSACVAAVLFHRHMQERGLL